MNKLSLMIRTCATITLFAFLAVSVYSQNRERFGISATAGGVNTVAGRVMIRRANETSEQYLSPRDDVEKGDVVTTGVGARVEVLLNPGTYFRVTENSEFKLADNSLDHLVINMTKGSAIIEATGPEEVAYHILVITDQSRFTIVRRGVYRFNVGRGMTELLVQKGRVLVEGQTTVVKNGMKVTFVGKTFATAKLNKKERDEFDGWSKERAEFLARANSKLNARLVNGYLANSASPFDPWGPFSTWRRGFGLWAYSPYAGCYTFLPFYWGWNSPYGIGYGHSGWFVGGYGGPGGLIVGNPNNGLYGGPYGGPSGGSTSSSSGSTGSRTVMPTITGSSPQTGSRDPGPTITSPPPSQAGPRDPDSGSRATNRIKDPIN